MARGGRYASLVGERKVNSTRKIQYLLSTVVGKLTEALAEFEHESMDWERKSGIALALARLGPPAAADAALQEIIAHDADIAAIQIAEVYAYRTERDAAFAWLERA